MGNKKHQSVVCSNIFDHMKDGWFRAVVSYLSFDLYSKNKKLTLPFQYFHRILGYSKVICYPDMKTEEVFVLHSTWNAKVYMFSDV